MVEWGHPRTGVIRPVLSRGRGDMARATPIIELAGGRDPVTGMLRSRIHTEDFFGRQPTASDQLPDPRPLLENLTRCVIEVLAGARELEQIARWVSDDVYRHLLKRVVLSSRARQARNVSTRRPTFAISEPLVSEPRDGVVEAVVIVRGRARVRAVAIRLEGLDRRWRATAIHVL